MRTNVTIDWVPLERVDTRTLGRVSDAQSWEDLADCGAWDVFSRADGIERWMEREDARIDREREETTERLAALKHGLRDAALAEARRNKSLVWRVVVGVLCLLAAENAERAEGGAAGDDIASALRTDRQTAFGGHREVLAAAESAAVIGIGAIGYQLAEDTKDARRQRARERVGIDYMHSTPARVGAAEPKALGAVEHRIDAQWALRSAKLDEEDIAMLRAADVGVQRSKARRTKHGIEEAIQKPEWAELAARAGESEKTVRARVRRVRRLLGIALEERGLVPPPRRRARRCEAKPEPAPSPFAGRDFDAEVLA